MYFVKVRSKTHDGSWRIQRQRVRPLSIRVAGDTPTLRAYREALQWWAAALSSGISVPLAPRQGFSAVGEAGCAFLFTDAEREAGSGFGGFLVIREKGASNPRFLYMTECWDGVALSQSRHDVLSIAGGGVLWLGPVVLVDAVARRLDGLTHLCGALQTASPRDQR